METDIFKMISIADIASLGNALCGVGAILAIFHYDLTLSAQLLLLAVVFDCLDGFLARNFGINSPEHMLFGETMDSLADVISFAIAPALIIYIITGVTYMLVPSLLLVATGILRLARYNSLLVYQDEPTTSFIGLPIPTTALILSGLLLISYINTYAYFILFLIIAIFMVSTATYPKENNPIIIVVMGILILLSLLSLNPQMYNIPAYLIIIASVLYIFGYPVVEMFYQPAPDEYDDDYRYYDRATENNSAFSDKFSEIKDSIENLYKRE